MTILHSISVMEMRDDGRAGVSFHCTEQVLNVYCTEVRFAKPEDGYLRIDMLNGDVWNIKGIGEVAATKIAAFLRRYQTGADGEGNISSRGTIAHQYEKTKQPVIGAQIHFDGHGLLVVLDIEGRLWRQYRDLNGSFDWVEVQLPIDERV